VDISDFEQHPGVFHPVNKLKEYWKRNKKEVSDIVDEDGHQYVDLVLEGGGVLGIALVGYTYALESVGIRFLGVGGTSAGAINALAVAALGGPQEAKSLLTLEELATLQMFEFVDGDHDARELVRAMVKGAGIVKLAWRGMQVIDNLNDDLGLNPGDEFLDWLTGLLGRHGVTSTKQLQDRMQPPQLYTRDGKKLPKSKTGAKLAVVTADITTETKVVFPEMAPLYWSRPWAVNPAHFVRASMSIPYFFWPYRVTSIPQGEKALLRWEEMAGYTGKLPDEVLMVDGGIVSNFPIDLFHSPGVPACPTFGAKLGVDRTEPRTIEKPLQMLGALFDSARHTADYTFLHSHEDYEHLVTFIKTGDHHWLNFFMEEDDKVDLFARGVAAGVSFLREFNWREYKEIRARNSGQ